jgi:hypothetical protein
MTSFDLEADMHDPIKQLEWILAVLSFIGMGCFFALIDIRRRLDSIIEILRHPINLH